MTADDQLQPLVDALVRARREGVALPMAPWLGLLRDEEAAYAVQRRVADALRWFEGGMPRHWKSGGPSRGAVLTHAGLPPAGVHQTSGGQPALLQGHAFHQRGIEAEIALRTRRDITRSEVAGWASSGSPSGSDIVDAMAVTIEVVDMRWQLPTPTASDASDAIDASVARLKLADQQAHGALVLGDWLPLPARIDWSRQRCDVRIGDRPAQRFEGTHPLGDPTWLLPAWLAHATREGRTVPAGTVVTTGTWCGVCGGAEGAHVSVSFDALGSVALQF